MFILIICLIGFCSSLAICSYMPTNICKASEANETYYARVLSDNVCLYKTPYDLDDYSNVLFILPKTYFVQLTDISGNFYKVNYYTFTGYVKKDLVQAVIGNPIKPYLNNVSFRVYSEQSRDLRTVPTTVSGSSSQVAYIPLYSRNLTFYGKIVGETLVEERTNVWYYCKYTADQEYYGYVYSDFCDFLTGLVDNTEDLPYTSNPTFTNNNTNKEAKLNNKATKIIIAVLMVPALIFIFLIIKGSKLLTKEHGKAKEVKDY